MTNPPSKDNQSSILRETRQEKGISLEMVHEATKIPLDALKAIEQGYSIHRLPPFYYRGFIRIYSKYLELDETKVLQSYGVHDVAVHRPQTAASAESSKPKQLRSATQAIATDNFVKDTLRPLLKRNLTGVRLEQALKGVALLISLIVAFRVIGCMISKPKTTPPPAAPKVQRKAAAAVAPAAKPAPKERSKPKREEVSKTERKAVEQNQLPEPAVPAMALTPEPVAPKIENKPVKSDSKTDTKTESKSGDKKARRIELTVRATKAGWLQVKTDGQIVFQSTLKKGAAETWTAADEIELSGKNINLLEFELNGKMLGSLGPSDRLAKRVVFTKDGLSVKK